MTSNNFGTLVVGATSDSLTWTVTNNGDVPTGTPTLTNGDPTEVLVGSNNCTVALAGGASCAIVVAFSPTQAGRAQRHAHAGGVAGRIADLHRERDRPDTGGAEAGARDRILDQLRQRAGRVDGDGDVRSHQHRPADRHRR